MKRRWQGRPARHEEVDVVALTDAVRGVVRDLDAYIERRAAELAAPRVEAAELACDQEMAEVLASANAREQRLRHVLAERERQLASLVKSDNKRREMVRRLTAYMDTLDPEEANLLRDVLDGTYDKERRA